MGSQCVAECVAKLVERGSSGIGGQCGRAPELGYALAPYSTMAVEPTLAYEILELHQDVHGVQEAFFWVQQIQRGQWNRVVFEKKKY